MKYLFVTATSVVAFMLFVACGSTNNADNNGTNNATNNATNNTTNNTTNNSTNNATNNATSGSNNATTGGVNNTTGITGWLKGGGPCPGSKTNAMYFPDRMHGYAGCGENGDGQGLYETNDGGATWDSLRDWEDIRVNDVREANGTVYAIGIHTSNAVTPLFILDENNDAVRSEYRPSDQAGVGVIQGENVVITSNDEIVIDGLVTDSTAFRDAAGAWTESVIDDAGTAIEIRSAALLDDRYIAVGSTINDEARVHLPSRTGAKLQTETLILQEDGDDGELRDLIVWNDEVLVAGFNQTNREPLLYTGTGDLYLRANWTNTELFDQGIEFDGTVWALSNQGDKVIAVGEKSPTSQGGFVLSSDDRGKTWTDITPTSEKVRPLTEVTLFPNGDIVVMGGGGELWSFGAP